MNTIFTSPKGGNCTTVTAAAHALLMSATRGNTLLIDLCGDLPATLGVTEPSGPGVNDWLGEDRAARADALVMLGAPVTEKLLLVHRGSQFVNGEPRWTDLAAACASLGVHVVIDAGTTYIHPDLRRCFDTVAMVTRPCYLSLRRATAQERPSGVYVIGEPDRALTPTDVSHVLGVPVLAEVPFTPAISRAVDAGLLATRSAQLFSGHLPLD